MKLGFQEYWFGGNIICFSVRKDLKTNQLESCFNLNIQWLVAECLGLVLCSFDTVECLVQSRIPEHRRNHTAGQLGSQANQAPPAVDTQWYSHRQGSVPSGLPQTWSLALVDPLVSSHWWAWSLLLCAHPTLQSLHPSSLPGCFSVCAANQLISPPYGLDSSSSLLSSLSPSPSWQMLACPSSS